MPIAKPAGVIVVENPNQDPVTEAWSKVDVYADIAASSDDEIARMTEKVKRAKADVASAQQALDNAKADKVTRAADLDAAKAELEAVEADHPELADAARARRDTASTQRVKELRDELARLKGGN